MRPLTLLALTLAAATAALAASERPRTLLLRNRHVLRELAFEGGVWRTVRLARANGSDAVATRSDEFSVLLMDGTELTLDQYAAAGEPVRDRTPHGERIRIRYVPRSGTPPQAPSAVTVSYWLGDAPYLRKSVELELREGQTVDRLEVERFSVAEAASGGGRGQPVWVNGRWFFGLEYPASYTRRTDGNTPAAYTEPFGRFGAYPSVIDLQGRDVTRSPRPGLIRLFHFPGYAKPLASGWGIQSKTSVAGIGTPSQAPELAFMDYLDTIRRPVRSFTHYNNWYDREGKDLRIPNFVGNTYLGFKRNLDPYGVKLDAMVPDNFCWHRPDSVYAPAPGPFPKGMDSMAELASELQRNGTNLGLWIALNGYSSDIAWGQRNGYVPAVTNENFKRYGPYYSITHPKYREAIRNRLRELITRCHIQYFKHDFNEMCDLGEGRGHPPTDRHGHEASVDATLDILALERECNPEIYQNVTNWSWFSPWWLMHCNNIWMLADDTGEFQGQPELSILVRAAAYRDVHLYTAWGNPAQRPLVPISHLMTHGIIFTKEVYGNQPGETLRDFADHVMMYYSRGTQLKEWYINPNVLTKPQWEALGRGTRWANENAETLATAVLVGGNPREGKPYGYIAWSREHGGGDHAILTARNPLPGEAELTVPFDASAWYRGPAGRAYRAEVVYPYQAPWPAAFRSGEPMRLRLPGNTVLVMRLQPGRPPSRSEISPAPIAVAADSRREGYESRVSVPDEQSQRADLLLISRNGELPAVSLDGSPAKPSRQSVGDGWRMAAFDLTPYRGRQVSLRVSNADIFGGSGQSEAWLLLDRPVPVRTASTDVRLPMPVAQGYRRQTVRLFAGERLGTATQRRPVSDAELAGIRAARVRIEAFGVQRVGGDACRLVINGGPSLEVPPNAGNDQWETRMLEVPPSMLGTIRRANRLQLLRSSGEDKFKFRGLALAVQLADGSWVATEVDGGVQTSHADWAYAEGRIFPTPLESHAVTLAFAPP